MEQHPENQNQQIIADFLAVVERLYFENYSLRQILRYSKLPDGTLAIPNWEVLLQDHLSNQLLADVMHQGKFAPLFERIRQATRTEVVDEVLRSIERSSLEE